MAARAQEYPQPDGYVVDSANIIDVSVEDYLEALIKALDQKTTAQIGVATVLSAKPTNIDSYATELFERWKIGQASKDNGVLLVIAKNDRNMRIEVGYGLEGELTDIEAKHILDDVIAPRFKANDFNTGVADGVKAIIDEIGAGYGIKAGDLGVAPVDTMQPIPEDATKFTWKEYLAVGGLAVFLLLIIILSLFTKTGRRNLRKGRYRAPGGGGGGSSPFGGGRSGGGGASGKW